MTCDISRPPLNLGSMGHRSATALSPPLALLAEHSELLPASLQALQEELGQAPSQGYAARRPSCRAPKLRRRSLVNGRSSRATWTALPTRRGLWWSVYIDPYGTHLTPILSCFGWTLCDVPLNRMWSRLYRPTEPAAQACFLYEWCRHNCHEVLEEVSGNWWLNPQSKSTGVAEAIPEGCALAPPWLRDSWLSRCPGRSLDLRALQPQIKQPHEPHELLDQLPSAPGPVSGLWKETQGAGKLAGPSPVHAPAAVKWQGRDRIGAKP